MMEKVKIEWTSFGTLAIRAKTSLGGFLQEMYWLSI